jgi:hypothetical protein
MRQVCAMAMFNFMRDAVFFCEIPGVRTQFIRTGLHDLHQDDVRQARRWMRVFLSRNFLNRANTNWRELDHSNTDLFCGSDLI